MVLAYWYAKAFVNAFTQAKGIDLDTNSIKVMLTTNTYTPNQDTHEDKADVTNEITGTGYTAGGVTPGTVTVTNTNNVVTIDMADAEWTSASFTARRAVYYDDSGATDADKALLFWVDFESDQTVSAGTFTIQHNASGVATITPTDATGFPA